MIKLPLPPHEMTWAEIREYILSVNVQAVTHLSEWKRVYRKVIGERLRARQPVPQRVVDAYYNERW